MNPPAPTISVLMAVYNGDAKLEQTVDAVLRQSFEDFEFIIVNDGSSDASEEILRAYLRTDSRIQVVSQPNRGLTEALIAGSERVRGRLLARQDVGDVSHSERFERQVDFLDQNPDVVAVGTGCRRIGPEGEYLGIQTRELTPREVTAALISEGVGLSHMAAMIRSDAFRNAGGYRAPFRFAQDSDLWYRLSEIGLLAELSDCLFDWGIDTGGISASNREKQSILAGLARQCYDARQSGASEAELLLKAESVSRMETPSHSETTTLDPTAAAEFFIGSQLFALGDARCRRYLRRALSRHPVWPRAWAKLALSFVKSSSRRKLSS